MGKKKKKKAIAVQTKKKKDDLSFTVSGDINIKMPSKSTKVHTPKTVYKRKPKHVKKLIDKYI